MASVTSEEIHQFYRPGPFEIGRESGQRVAHIYDCEGWSKTRSLCGRHVKQPWSRLSSFAVGDPTCAACLRRFRATDGGMQAEVRAVKSEMVKCRRCGHILKGRIPKDGDGSILYPYKHDRSDGKPCDGHWVEGSAIDVKNVTEGLRRRFEKRP